MPCCALRDVAGLVPRALLRDHLAPCLEDRVLTPTILESPGAFEQGSRIREPAAPSPQSRLPEREIGIKKLLFVFEPANDPKVPIGLGAIAFRVVNECRECEMHRREPRGRFPPLSKHLFSNGDVAEEPIPVTKPEVSGSAEIEAVQALQR